MAKIHWDANPARKLCEIELFNHEGYKVRVCTKPYGRYSPGAKKALMKMAEGMPKSNTRESLIEMIPDLISPKELKLQQSCVAREREMPKFDELLTNDHLNRVVTTLALNRIPTADIVKIVNDLDGNYNFSFDQIDKFLFRYCNTRADHGWTIHRQQEYEEFLRNSYGLKSTFSFELENGFGHLAQSVVLINLGIATNIQVIDHLLFELMDKVRSSLDNLDLEKPLPKEDSHYHNMKNVHTVRALQLSTAKELSMLLNRFSKTKTDFQKINDFDQADTPQFRIHRKSQSARSGTTNPYLRDSG